MIVRSLPFIVLSFTACSGCGSSLKPSGVVPQSVPRVNRSMPVLPDDADVKLIASEFYANAQVLGVEVEKNVKSITFVEGYGKCHESTVGQCEFFTYDDGTQAYKELTLRKSTWETESPQFKRTLLFHELGHCALGLDHAAPDAEAIMNPSVLNDDVASSRWYSLVRDLFATDRTFGLTEETLNNDECGE